MFVFYDHLTSVGLNVATCSLVRSLVESEWRNTAVEKGSWVFHPNLWRHKNMSSFGYRYDEESDVQVQRWNECVRCRSNATIAGLPDIASSSK